MKLCEKLVLLRKEKRMSQMEVAENLNVSRQAISRWEQGNSDPSTENLKSLSVLYGVPVDYLLHEHYSYPDINNSQENCVGKGRAEKKNRRAWAIGIAVILVIMAIGIALWKTKETDTTKVQQDTLAETHEGDPFDITW